MNDRDFRASVENGRITITHVVCGETLNDRFMTVHLDTLDATAKRHKCPEGES